MTISIFATMRQIIASARSAEGEILEDVRRIDDVIDDVPNEAKQACGEILLNLSHVREELDRLDMIAEQLEAVIAPHIGKGGLAYRLTMTDGGGVLVERVDK